MAHTHLGSLVSYSVPSCSLFSSQTGQLALWARTCLLSPRPSGEPWPFLGVGLFSCLHLFKFCFSSQLHPNWHEPFLKSLSCRFRIPFYMFMSLVYFFICLISLFVYMYHLSYELVGPLKAETIWSWEEPGFPNAGSWTQRGCLGIRLGPGPHPAPLHD